MPPVVLRDRDCATGSRAAVFAHKSGRAGPYCPVAASNDPPSGVLDARVEIERGLLSAAGVFDAIRTGSE